MKYQISVTKGDIKRGRRLTSLSCPIAHAVNRALGLTKRSTRYAGIGVRLATIRTKKGTVLRAQLPEEARGFITIFDASGKATPLKFELDFKKVSK
jgi:hypothetical protein